MHLLMWTVCVGQLLVFLKCRPGRKNKVSKGNKNKRKNKTSKDQKHKRKTTQQLCWAVCVYTLQIQGLVPSKDSAYATMSFVLEQSLCTLQPSTVC